MGQWFHNMCQGALAAAEFRLFGRTHRGCYDLLDDAIWFMDHQGRIRYANAAFQAMTGKLPRVLYGSNFRDLILDEVERNAFDEALCEARKGVPLCIPLNSLGTYNTESRIEVTMRADANGRTRKQILGVARDITQAEHTRELVLRRDAWFRALIERSYDMILVLDAHGVIQYESPACERVMGFPQNEHLGRSAFEFVHPDDEPGLSAAFFECVQTPHALRVARARLQHADGRWRWVENTAQNMLDDPRIRGVVIHAQDITGRLEAEERLRIFQQVVEQIPVAVLIADPVGKIEYANPAFTRITGRTCEEAAWLMDPAIAPSGLLDNLTEKLRAGDTWRGEIQNLHKDGSRLWEMATISPLLNEHGSLSRFVSVKMDITALKTAQEALERSEEKFRILFERSSIPHILHDDERGILDCNQAALWLFKIHNKREILGQRASDFSPAFQPDGRSSRERGDILSEQLRKEGFLRFEWLHQRSDGDVFPAEVSTTLVHLDGKDVVLTELHDLTEPRQAEAELIKITQELELRNWELARARDQALEASRLRGEFMATLSHELRTPMNAILGMTGMLMRAPLSPTHREMVEIIHRSGNGLLEKINDILDFRKLEEGKLEMERAPFDLLKLVEEEVALFAGLASRKGIEILCDLDPGLPERVVGDAQRLRQIIANLMGNAIKFTPVGHVEISARILSTEASILNLKIEVSDTGIGISRDAQEKLFTPFAQVSGTSSNYGGTGLGLAICHQLAELMGGSIGVHSQPGAGSQFWLELPLTTTSPHETPQTCPLQDRSIVLSGFSARATEFLCAWIEAAGGTCRMLETGGDFETLLTEAPCDVLLLGSTKTEKSNRAWSFVLRSFCESRGLPLILLVPLGNNPGDPPPSCVMREPLSRITLCKSLKMVCSGSTVTQEVPVPEISLPRFLGTRVLVVDDNTVNLHLMRGLLSELGAESDIVDSGAAGIDQLRQASYDLVFMDALMPDMDGYETTRLIRERVSQPIPIIAVTAMALPGEREKALAAGMDDFMTKPIKQEDLIRALAKWGPGAHPGTQEPLSFPAVDQNAQEAPVLDTSTLAKLKNIPGPVEGNLAAHVIGVYLGELPARLEDLRKALDEGDLEQCARIAHQVKGAAGNLGLLRFQEQCRQMELAGREKNLPAAQDLFLDFTALHKASQIALESFLQKGGSN